MKYSHILICISFSILFSQSDKMEAEEQSDLSKMMKASGSLLVKESHSLPSLKTSYGSDIKSSIFVLRNLSGVGSSEMGLKLSVKEEYSTRQTFLDFEELEGLLSSITIIQNQGRALCLTPSINVPEGSENNTEIDYITKDGLKFGVYVNKKNKLIYAIQVNRLADWAFLKEEGVEQLKKNIETILNLTY